MPNPDALLSSVGSVVRVDGGQLAHVPTYDALLGLADGAPGAG